MKVVDQSQVLQDNVVSKGKLNDSQPIANHPNAEKLKLLGELRNNMVEINNNIQHLTNGMNNSTLKAMVFVTAVVGTFTLITGDKFSLCATLLMAGCAYSHAHVTGATLWNHS